MDSAYFSLIDKKTNLVFRPLNGVRIACADIKLEGFFIKLIDNLRITKRMNAVTEQGMPVMDIFAFEFEEANLRGMLGQWFSSRKP
ncbi:MAG: hypothetical protein WAU54_04695 [Chania sp.]